MIIYLININLTYFNWFISLHTKLYYEINNILSLFQIILKILINLKIIICLTYLKNNLIQIYYLYKISLKEINYFKNY